MITKKQQIIFSTFCGIVLVILVSCDDSEKYERYEAESIQYYLNNNGGFNFQLKPSGLYYYEVETGAGPAPLIHDTAYIRYTGMFLNGTIFESNMQDNEPFSFPVSEGVNVAGFDEGITYMKTGGYSIFLVPSSLAYGAKGTNKYWIPGYTPLLYEVELLGVAPGPGD